MKIFDLENEDEKQPDPEEWMDKAKLGDAKDAADLAVSLMAHRFTDSVTMHGLRYVFMRDAHYIRRLVWTCVVLAGMSYCSYILYQSWIAFLSYPTITRVMRKYEPKSEFPAVTICPYNVFRKSGITERQEKALGKLYGGYFIPFDYHSVNLSEFDDMDMLEFYRNASHDIHIDYCAYKGRPCEKRLFTETITDYGICHLFDPSVTPEYRYQNTAGQAGGFDFSDAVFDDEWTYGPHMVYDGYRIAVHPPGTAISYLRDKGFSLLPGYGTDVIIHKRKYGFLSKPYGQCGESKLEYFDEYSLEKCLLECETRFTVKKCGCRYIYMPGDAKFCSLSQLQSCSNTLLDPFANDTELFDNTKCNCPQECSKIEYDLHITHTAPTQGYKDIMLQIINLDINNAMQLRLYFTDLEYMELTETAVYSFERLMCDVGGAGGLFLGASFATMFEFVDFSFEMVWVWVSRWYAARKRRRNQIHEVTQ